MKRQVSLEEISDGRLYCRRDMARVGCAGCRGCSQCCHGMGQSVILDPLDLHRLSGGTGLPFEELLAAGLLELNVVDGVILPNLCMSREGEACGFLNEEGRCRIHPYRPGFCRLFPLGRYYLPEEETKKRQAETAGGQGGRAGSAALSFRYILQIHECPAPNKTKVRIEKWMDQPDPDRYEEFVLQWHRFLLRAGELVLAEKDPERRKNINLYILKLFYFRPYGIPADSCEQFYEQFAARLIQAADCLEIDVCS